MAGENILLENIDVCAMGKGNFKVLFRTVEFYFISNRSRNMKALLSFENKT